MKKLRLIAAALTAALVLGLCACGEQPGPGQETSASQGTEPTDMSASAEQTDPTHFYEEVQEGLVIDAAVEGPEPGFVPCVYEIEQAVTSREQLNAFLAKRGEKIETVEYEENTEESGSNYIASTDMGSRIYLSSIDNERYTGNSLNYQTASDHWYYNDYVFMFVDDEQIRAMWEKHGIESGNFDCIGGAYLEPRELAFATAAEAEETARQAMAELGIEGLILDQTFYMDHETMAKVEADTIAMVAEANAEDVIIGKSDGNGNQQEYTPKESWTEADDCYTFVFRGGADGLMMARDGVYRETVHYSPMCVTVRVGAEGIRNLESSQVWRVKEPVEQPERLIPAGQALEAAKEKISEVVVWEDRVVSRVSLRYQYMQDRDRWVMRPVWEVTVLRKVVHGDFPYDEYSYIMIDAITGKEI